MNLKIIKEKENKLLSRKEVVATINFDGTTPSRKKVQKELAKAVKADEKVVIIKHINTSFGSSFAEVIANVYSDEKVLATLERKNLVEKHIGHEPKKAEGEE